MENNWVDFKAIKGAVSLQTILERYQINWLRKSGDELRGRCPIHLGGGMDTFHASLSKNAFQCFSCKARGNVLDFVAAMEECSVRDAALRLKEWFTIDGAPTAPPEKTGPTDPDESGESATAKNTPLDFQLKGVDSSHPYLSERGISKDVAEEFGIGYFSGKGSMSGRIVIPIHNEQGELVAYAGRSIDGSEPRYKLPAGFHKSVELFNLHRVIEDSNPERRVVVVEGFFDCLKVNEAKFPCVALMGSSMSVSQEALLGKYFRIAVVMFDGDEAGRSATNDCLARLGHLMWIRSVRLPTGMQPDKLGVSDLHRMLYSL